MGKPDQNNSSIPALLTRIYWFAFGHAALIFLILSISKNKLSVFNSLLYFLFLGILIAAKYIDVKYLDGTNAEGDKPATMADFKGFFKVVMIIYTIVFISLLFLQKLI